MQTLDDLFQRSGVHRHLIAPGRGAGTREEPDRHLVANCPREKVGQDARSSDRLGDELGQIGQAFFTDGFGREQRDHGYPACQ